MVSEVKTMATFDELQIRAHKKGADLWQNANGSYTLRAHDGRSGLFSSLKKVEETLARDVGLRRGIFKSTQSDEESIKKELSELYAKQALVANKPGVNYWDNGEWKSLDVKINHLRVKLYEIGRK
jgi:hypothetical protein